MATRNEIFIFDMMYLSENDPQLKAFFYNILNSSKIKIIGQNVYSDLEDIAKKLKLITKEGEKMVIKNFINIDSAYQMLYPN